MTYCNHCKQTKDSADFYKSTIRSNATGECKDCVRNRVKANRNKKAEYYRDFDRQRANLPCRVQARKEYKATERGKAASVKANSSYRKRNPKIHQAHNLVNNSLRDGKLIAAKQCETCGIDCSPHAHHCDYNKPLDVMWLCDPCHKRWHRQHKPIY